MSESSVPADPKYRTSLSGKDVQKRIDGLNNPPGVWARLRKLVSGKTTNLGTAVAVGTATVVGGAAVEATTHPIENTVSATVDAINQTSDEARQVANQVDKNIDAQIQGVKNFYSESEAVDSYSKDVEMRMTGQSPLKKDEGESFFGKVQFHANRSIRDYPGFITPDGHQTKEVGLVASDAEISSITVLGGRTPAEIAQGHNNQLWYVVKYAQPQEGTEEQIGYISGIDGKPLAPAQGSIPEGAHYIPVTIQRLTAPAQ